MPDPFRRGLIAQHELIIEVSEVTSLRAAIAIMPDGNYCAKLYHVIHADTGPEENLIVKIGDSPDINTVKLNTIDYLSRIATGIFNAIPQTQGETK